MKCDWEERPMPVPCVVCDRRRTLRARPYWKFWLSRVGCQTCEGTGWIRLAHRDEGVYVR